jgi:hypothetical protein
MISHRIFLIVSTLTILMIASCVSAEDTSVYGTMNSINVKASIPLSIYNVFTSKISYNFATINWKTNGLASSQIYYDTVPHAMYTDYKYVVTKDLKKPVSSHEVKLNSLNDGTTYHYRIVSKMKDVATAVSEDHSFITSKHVKKTVFEIFSEWRLGMPWWMHLSQHKWEVKAYLSPFF